MPDISNIDLEDIIASLESAYYKSKAEDIVDAYKKTDGRAPSSPLTKALEGSLNKAKSYKEE